MRKPIVMDGRNCYDLEDVKAVPMIYESIGRVTVNNLEDGTEWNRRYM